MKAYICYIPDETSAELHNVAKECYLKSEADKVIAELKHQRDGAFGLTNLGLTLDYLSQMAKKEIDRQKYKRCLAMARLCLSKDCQMLHEASDSGTFFKESWFWKRALWYGKWTRRWLELAEKFKEAK